MSEFRFEAEIVLGDVVPAGEVVRERVYDGVTVVAEWPDTMAPPEVRLALRVHGEIDPRDAPAYVELFFHDVFLLLNLAAPGSFGGTISITGGTLRVRELTFDARVFAYAAPLRTLPLADVVSWYERLHLGTRQLADDGVAVALLQLLHLARSTESEIDSILRLAIASNALEGRLVAPARLFELRDDIAQGRMPMIHPMHDEVLDPRVEDVTHEWIEVADDAARAVIGALQDAIRSHAS